MFSQDPWASRQRADGVGTGERGKPVRGPFSLGRVRRWRALGLAQQQWSMGSESGYVLKTEPIQVRL